MEQSLARPPSFAGSFASLQPTLAPWLTDVVQEMGFSQMTPVQASVIPLALKNKDLLVEAVTGSGKTLAYLLPLIQRLINHETNTSHPLRKNEVFGIVVVPTRELAVQIWEIADRFWGFLRREAEVKAAEAAEAEALKAELAELSDEEEKITTPEEQLTRHVYPPPLLLISGQKSPSSTPPPPSPIIISTPGRLASYLSSTTPSPNLVISSFAKSTRLLSLGAFDTLVLDEADGLLSSPDHLRSMRTIWSLLPRLRRNWLFSATMMDVLTEDVKGLESAGLRNLVRVVVRVERKRKGDKVDEDGEGKRQKMDEIERRADKERRTPVSLQNTYLMCNQSEKTLQLIRLLQYETQHGGSGKFIAYFSTCAAVEYFYRTLKRLPSLSTFQIFSLHGHLPTSARSTTLSSFTHHASLPTSPSLLLCTDVAARGLDLPDVDVVVQYDPPVDPKMFSHRAGRTARMGRKGKGVVLLVRGREEGYVEFLHLRRLPLRERAYLDENIEECRVVDPDTPGPSTAADQQYPVDPTAITLMEELRDIVLTDRELADKAAKAYVSAVRAYSKHEASYIFQLKDLDLFGLGVAFGCLRLPKMPEIRAWKDRLAKVGKAREKVEEKGEGEVPDIPGDGIGWQDREMDWDTFPYASKPRETARLEALAAQDPDIISAEREKAAALRRAKADRASAWSVKHERKERKEIRKEKKEKKKDWEDKVKKAEAGEVVKEDVEDFADDYKELRRQAKTRKQDLLTVGTEWKAPKAVTKGGMFDDME